MILWVRDLGRAQVGDSSAQRSLGRGHSLGCMWLAWGLGWKVQEGFTQVSSILVLFHTPSLSLSQSTVASGEKDFIFGCRLPEG